MCDSGAESIRITAQIFSLSELGKSNKVQSFFKRLKNSNSYLHKFQRKLQKIPNNEPSAVTWKLT